MSNTLSVLSALSRKKAVGPNLETALSSRSACNEQRFPQNETALDCVCHGPKAIPFPNGSQEVTQVGITALDCLDCVVYSPNPLIKSVSNGTASDCSVDCHCQCDCTEIVFA